MEDFAGKVAVVTGAGDGMGRSLATQLAAHGCHVAMCDLFDERLAATKAACDDAAPSGTLITTHRCDVADEAQLARFAGEVADEHETAEINLLFNNAGIGGRWLDDRRPAIGLGAHVRRVLVRRLHTPRACSCRC